MQDPTQPVPEKRRRRKEERPGEIIAAALKIWLEQGFSATRLEDIARGAGIAKGTIYLYFPSKEALFEAALKDRLIAMMDRADAMAQDFEGSTEELLNRFFVEVHTQLTEGGAGAFLKVLVAEGHRFPELVAFYKANVIARGVTAIRAILARGVARGELRAGAEDTDPRLILAPALVGTIWSIVFGDASMPTTRDTLSNYARILIAGLARGS